MTVVMAKRGGAPRDTRGRKALAKLLAERSQGAVAKAIGVSQVSVSKWASGAYRPTALPRRKLERIFGIPEADWMTADEARFLEAS